MTALHDALVGASPGARERLVGVMPKAIAGHDVGDRPGRVESQDSKPRPQGFDTPTKLGAKLTIA